MTLYLRTIDGDTLLDAELNIAKENDDDTDWQHTAKSYIELHSVVPIAAYSKFLLDNPKRQQEIISTFDELSELRGWLWETYFMGEKNDPKEFDKVKKELSRILQSVASRFELVFITD